MGAENHTGAVHYENIEAALRLEGVTPHIYGKKETRPFRKNGTCYHRRCRFGTGKRKSRTRKKIDQRNHKIMAEVGIIMGSESRLTQMQAAIDVLNRIKYRTRSRYCIRTPNS